MSGLLRKLQTGQSDTLWPVVLLVVLVVVPTLAVLWFVSVASRNERLANQQRLADAYRSNLNLVAKGIDGWWLSYSQRLATGLPGDSLPEKSSDERARAQRRFDAVAHSGLADSAICIDVGGTAIYPSPPPASGLDPIGPRWTVATQLEYQQNDPLSALAQYRAIADSDNGPVNTARALQAMVRCLLRLERLDEAAQITWNRFTGPAGDARDGQGRLIAANVELMVLQRIATETPDHRLKDRLASRLTGQGGPTLPSAQRTFIMKQLHSLAPNLIDQQVLDAEDLAGHFALVHPTPSLETRLQSSQLPGVWTKAAPELGIVALLETATVKAFCQEAADRIELPPGVALMISAPAEDSEPNESLSIRAGGQLPGWRLALVSDIPGERGGIPGRQLLYRWAAALIVLLVACLALAIAVSFRRQIHVANLKNDLLDTVSHELKTPLASMRLLVDTLIESDHLDADQRREYLSLVARENTRLSRLIENFLTFSRLEKDRQQFHFRWTNIDALLTRVVESAGPRFESEDCQLSVVKNSADESVWCDEDAILMGLLNFLDNAYKFSTAPRRIILSVDSDRSVFTFSVSDNGIGLSKAEAKRVFDRFYQVDQSLIRQGQGCGLGLSIVKSIAEAHGGRVSVSSSPRKGSTFSILLPLEGGENLTHE